ncbi:QRFPR-like protein [Mya arenaria]|uniref:QRFPR-like protein n=1 Tax=Mya arenaria TaxID=6604 RepID=A0ABY7DIZ2_MYAAR|nr:QRFP-like peptide receptor [Mya arenaria]WAQ96576.1 QRFPR-like protein [Mya arenaria]
MPSECSTNASLDTTSGHTLKWMELLLSISNKEKIRLCHYTMCENRVHHPLYLPCKHAFPDFYSEIELDRAYSQTLSSTSKAVLSFLLVAVMILSVSGNSLVVLTFIYNKHMRSVTNVFILSLAISDLMVTFTCIPVNMGTVLRVVWVFGDFGCKMMPCVTQFSVTCSSLTLCCIAFDRYYAIVHPLKLKLWQTTKRATILQVFVWVTSAATSIPYIFFYETDDISACHEFGEESKVVCKAADLKMFRKVMDTWVTLPVLFFGPFLFMSVIYTIICYQLWMQRPIGASRKTFDGRLKLKQKVIKMLIMVVLIFVVCESPLLLFNAASETNHLQLTQANITLRAFLQCLALSSTCWNPLVYAFMNEKFRVAFRTLVTCKKGKVYPVMLVRNNAMRMSTESRKTTSQLEATLPVGTQQTSETKV